MLFHLLVGDKLHLSTTSKDNTHHVCIPHYHHLNFVKAIKCIELSSWASSKGYELSHLFYSYAAMIKGHRQTNQFYFVSLRFAAYVRRVDSCRFVRCVNNAEFFVAFINVERKLMYEMLANVYGFVKHPQDGWLRSTAATVSPNWHEIRLERRKEEK